MASPWLPERASFEKPPCKYGVACYRRHPEHRAHFSHPPDVTGSSFRGDLLAGVHKDRRSIPPFRNSSACSRGPALLGAQDLVQDEVHGDATPLMLILAGPPGSGKSTFADALVHRGRLRWTRVCQDIAASGNQGTRQQCLKQAQRALQSKHYVIIDRCNIERDQRADFVALARRMRVPVHAVFFDLPFQLVVQRAASRVAHEGGVQGAMAEGVIRRFLRTREVPSESEGFASILVCKSDAEVLKALDKYKILGASEVTPLLRTPFRQPLQSQQPGTVYAPTGIASTGLGPGLHFREQGLLIPKQHSELAFQGEGDSGSVVDDPMEVDGPERLNEERRGRTNGASSSEPGRREANGKRKLDDVIFEARTHAGTPGHQNVGASGRGFSNSEGGEAGKHRPPKDERGADSGAGKGQEDASECPAVSLRTKDNNGGESCFRLAFPSISTADFMFDHQQAADIIVDKVSCFLDRADPKLHLLLVDLSGESDISKKVRSAASEKGLQLGAGTKFQTHGGDITKLRSTGGPESQVIANAANWRLKPGGGGVNAAIYNAAGPDFVQATKREGESLSPGAVLPVEVPPSSPLRLNEGVTHVIHVLGPNMNAGRPSCLNDDYDAGRRLLRAAYQGLFDAFEKLATAGGSEPSTSREARSSERANEADAQPQKKVRNAFELLMHSARKHEPGGPSRGSSEGRVPASSSPGRKQELQKRNGWSGKGAWSEALRDVTLHPEKHPDEVLDREGDVVVIRDKYHKAKVHFLALASVDGLDTPYELRREHVPLLEQMVKLGRKWAVRASEEDPSLRFRFGFHAEPSMRQVHLHVISQDFESEHLKHKKHWNSFTTPFFVDATAVIAEVEKNGQLAPLDPAVLDNLLKKELRCHKCRCAQPNIPRLKAHIRTCDAPIPGEVLVGATS